MSAGRTNSGAAATGTGNLPPAARGVVRPPSRKEYEELVQTQRLRIQGLTRAIRSLEAELRAAREQTEARGADHEQLRQRIRALEAELLARDSLEAWRKAGPLVSEPMCGRGAEAARC